MLNTLWWIPIVLRTKSNLPWLLLVLLLLLKSLPRYSLSWNPADFLPNMYPTSCLLLLHLFVYNLPHPLENILWGCCGVWVFRTKSPQECFVSGALVFSVYSTFFLYLPHCHIRSVTYLQQCCCWCQGSCS